MIYEGKEFKQYPLHSNYYISEYGDIYSVFSGKLLNPMKRNDGHLYVDIYEGAKQKHKLVHRMVYQAWCGEIPEGCQINHYDDDPTNNHYKNLYIGSQKENIQDCIRNNHRMGHIKSVTVFDKEINELIQFPSIKSLIEYTGHSVKNGSISKMKTLPWFFNRFDIIKEESVSTRESYNRIEKQYREWLENKALSTKRVS